MFIKGDDYIVNIIEKKLDIDDEAKYKLDNPKEKLYKKIKLLENKKDRIRKAYINESFTLEEYDKEISIVEASIKDLKRQLLENEQANDMNFTMEDILLKRDLTFLNKIKFPTLYKGIINKDEKHVIFNPQSLINPSEVNKAISNINKQMEQEAEEFYNTYKNDY